jgi:hypothetical protein
MPKAAAAARLDEELGSFVDRNRRRGLRLGVINGRRSEQLG